MFDAKEKAPSGATNRVNYKASGACSDFSSYTAYNIISSCVKMYVGHILILVFMENRHLTAISQLLVSRIQHGKHLKHFD